MVKKYIFVAAFTLGCTSLLAQSFFDPLGPVAAEQKDQTIKFFWTVMVAALPVFLGLPFVLWRYRRKGGHGKYRPEFAHSKPLETAFWGLPIALTLLLAYWLISSVIRLDPYKPLGENPLKIQVVGLDWKWLFIYPDQNIASVGTLAIPAGQAVELDMTTDTVMQSLLIPQLAGQVYAMPGMITKLNLLADKPSQTTGFNSQYNGEKFNDQIVNVEALAPADFEAWVAGAGNAPTLDDQTYQILGLPGNLEDAQKALGMSDTRLQLGNSDIFNMVVMRYHSGEAVHANQQPGTEEYKAEISQ